MSSGILIEQQMRKLPKIEDPYEYAKNKLFMYAGEMIPVSFLCNEKILDQMIDIFGRDVFISKREDGKFVLSTRTSKKGAIFLAQQFLDSIQILEPEDLRSEFAKDLQSALTGYLDNGSSVCPDRISGQSIKPVLSGSISSMQQLGASFFFLQQHVLHDIHAVNIVISLHQSIAYCTNLFLMISGVFEHLH